MQSEMPRSVLASNSFKPIIFLYRWKVWLQSDVFRSTCSLCKQGHKIFLYISAINLLEIICCIDNKLLFTWSLYSILITSTLS